MTSAGRSRGGLAAVIERVGPKHGRDAERILAELAEAGHARELPDGRWALTPRAEAEFGAALRAGWPTFERLVGAP